MDTDWFMNISVAFPFPDTDRRIYVSLAVGHDHKRTAMSDFVNPQWTEKFVL